MAVEIREIVLRARVIDDGPGEDGEADAAQIDVDALFEEVMRAVDARIEAEFRRRGER